MRQKRTQIPPNLSTQRGTLLFAEGDVLKLPSNRLQIKIFGVGRTPRLPPFQPTSVFFFVFRECIRSGLSRVIKKSRAVSRHPPLTYLRRGIPRSFIFKFWDVHVLVTTLPPFVSVWYGTPGWLKKRIACGRRFSLVVVVARRKDDVHTEKTSGPNPLKRDQHTTRTAWISFVATAYHDETGSCVDQILLEPRGLQIVQDTNGSCGGCLLLD